MGGTEALDAPYLSVGFWPMVKKRGGWLAILFLGEMLTATAMGYFEGEIERAAVVALFVPLIISSGGNSGSQGTSLIIRSLALKEIKLVDWWRVFGRELRTGLALGLFLGIIGFLRIGAWQGLSYVPVVGPFFHAHNEENKLVIPPNMQMAEEDITVGTEVSIPGYTLPKGSIIQKGQIVPAGLHVQAIDPKTHREREVAFRSAGQKVDPSAYGKHWKLVGLTVFFALIGVVAWGSLAGSMLPFLLRRLGFDPATSSAPFVATLVDVTGLIIYFLVAKLILTGTLL
jgi:Mg/Co/Ni transporter MgtE